MTFSINYYGFLGRVWPPLRVDSINPAMRARHRTKHAMIVPAAPTYRRVAAIPRHQSVHQLLSGSRSFASWRS